MKNLFATLILSVILLKTYGQSLERSFQTPEDAYKPWTYWFWINGNISKKGISKDLEAMKRVGINGVLWMEVSGPYWAPQGPVEAGTKEWGEMMQWAISEADRLKMDVDLTVDFGYGCGGPHITPDNSMKELVWSETRVEGGKLLSLNLQKPKVDVSFLIEAVGATDTPSPEGFIMPWLRPGERLPEKVTKGLKEIDSYCDIAVFAVNVTDDTLTRLDDTQLSKYDGRSARIVSSTIDELKLLSPIVHKNIIDITDKMGKNGELNWNAPVGKWQIFRLGYATNLQMTRPSPGAAVGLECDRLNPRGIEAHFNNHLKPILDAAGDKAGKTLQYIHIDSWEAHGQNWSEGFAEEFQKKRGYNIKPWLPVLTGILVQNEEMTTRFLWDMRLTVSELMLENYVDRLKELLKPYGVEFSTESYGNFGVDNLTYGGRGELPIAEFWTPKNYDAVRDKGDKEALRQFFEPIKVDAGDNKSLKSLASVANTYGRKRLGAESFTGSRAWGNHPWLIKGIGDHAFAQGINHFIYHLYAHQAYDNMVPGLTHRRWGLNFQRHQTWWEFSKPYFDYVARCQTLLQQGTRVADFICLPEEGSPVRLNHPSFDCPEGFDYDVCSSEIIQHMEVKNGKIHLPSGVSYEYLLLPQTGRLTIETAKKVEALRKAGATIYKQVSITGTPGLAGYPESDLEVRKLAENWPLLAKDGLEKILANDKLIPDFQGENLDWLHRKSGGDDIYFVANPKYIPIKQSCTFRISGKSTELWDPETGDIFPLSDVQENGHETKISLPFSAAQSWFVVFREKPTVLLSKNNPFPEWETVQTISGEWILNFNPKWGIQEKLASEKLKSWTEFQNPLLKYYSGTCAYQTVFNVSETVSQNKNGVYIDLGEVAVMARVKLNGIDCGTVWKPPYRVEISQAVQKGENQLQVEVVNTWANRLIGDEQLPLDGDWKDWEVLLEWPEWFIGEKERTSGRYTFTSVRHYEKDDPLPPAGLLGPVKIITTR